MHWESETPEPLLVCLIADVHIYRGPLDKSEQRLRELEARGWRYSPRNGAIKALHVDEIEKIEGDPPEGPF